MSKCTDYYSIARGWVIEDRAFKGQDEAIAYLKKVCDMSGKEATHYTNMMVAAFQKERGAANA